MTNIWKCFTLVLVMIAVAVAVDAQSADTLVRKPVEMADTMRSNGKIYVVVAVLTIIFVGIIFYLVRLEARIKQLEKSAATN
ncbi:MAG TPA: hypothetical protein VLC98_03395 [Phnomibacter sp.]|nr:hypothetical protein [Phnomibacter sp.]